jgi:uncharacterized phage protein (TIGR01671 family)
MREILFRGKDTVTGEWISGFLVDAKHIGDWIEAIPVHPETVGQFTGLTDKNGTKIFEGDIVEGHCHSRWRHDVQRCEIAYGRDGFEARHHVQCGEEKRYYAYKVLFSKDVVVIGNIHDKPELLEV